MGCQEPLLNLKSLNCLTEVHKKPTSLGDEFSHILDTKLLYRCNCTILVRLKMALVRDEFLKCSHPAANENDLTALICFNVVMFSLFQLLIKVFKLKFFS